MEQNGKLVLEDKIFFEEFEQEQFYLRVSFYSEICLSSGLRQKNKTVTREGQARSPWASKRGFIYLELHLRI